MVKHPARFSNELIPVFAEMLDGCRSILDPFGGTGKVFLLHRYKPGLMIRSVELEPEWATDIVGSALTLPFADESFDAVCTSPTYGNRMADGLLVNRWSYRTYAQLLGRKLNNNNSGALQWGEKYRDFHRKAWREVARVVRHTLVLNVKNHIRNGVEQSVVEWHVQELESLGFVVKHTVWVKTKLMTFGENREKRCVEKAILMRKKDVPLQ